VQALQNIKLASLELEAVEKWWKLVEQYEKNHGPWDRRRIDTSVRDKIDRRWMDDSLWENCLPAQIQQAKKGGWRSSSLEWMDPEKVSSSMLYTYLYNCARAGMGKSVGNLKHEELIDWIRQQDVIFSREKLLESYEAFQSEVLKRKILAMGTVEFLPSHAKLVCEEINSSVKRWAKSREADTSIARCFQISMTHDEKKDIDKTLWKLHDGFRQAMQQIVLNPVFNTSLFKKSGHTDKEEERGRSMHRRENEKKREKSSSPSPNPKGSPKKDSSKGDNKARPKCNGCGSWKSEAHTEASCPFIRDKVKGYNAEYETKSWEDSEAGKALKAKGHDFLRKPRDSAHKGNNCIECLSISSCNSCHIISNFLSKNPSNLPFINAILFSQGK
jgi:hypothetical protein